MGKEASEIYIQEEFSKEVCLRKLKFYGGGHELKLNITRT